MNINKTRANNFRQNIQDLQGELGFRVYYDAVEKKLIDLIVKGELQGESLMDFRKQIGHVFHPDFIKYVDRIWRTYDNIINIANDLYSDISDNVHRDLPQIQALEKINASQLGAYEKNTVKDIAKKIRNGILDGLKSPEIAKDLAKLGDKVEFYANTLATTQVSAYGRETKHVKAQLGEVFYYQYIGITKTVRPFCVDHLNQTYHIKEIVKMKNGQIEPVIRYCGGYNCHHDWEPDPFYSE